MANRGKYNPMLDSYELDHEFEVEVKQDWLLDALDRSKVDPAIEARKPEIIFSIREQVATSWDYRRVFTLGNFSAIIGKAKSKKTYLLGAISSTIISGRLMWEKFQGGLMPGKDTVIYFDTEQGEWDSWNVVNRIARMGGGNYKDRFKAFNLRSFTPIQRCEIIEFALNSCGDKSGLVVIDGVADLANAINDEVEATRVISLLMRWSKDYNTHISTVIHQNKADNFATGHLGSGIMKKAEIIISVTKDAADPYSSLVECNLSRGIDFRPFKLSIDSFGLPVIEGVTEEAKEINFDSINKEVPF